MIGPDTTPLSRDPSRKQRCLQRRYCTSSLCDCQGPRSLRQKKRHQVHSPDCCYHHYCKLGAVVVVEDIVAVVVVVAVDASVAFAAGASDAVVVAVAAAVAFVVEA